MIYEYGTFIPEDDLPKVMDLLRRLLVERDMKSQPDAKPDPPSLAPGRIAY